MMTRLLSSFVFVLLCAVAGPAFAQADYNAINNSNTAPRGAVMMIDPNTGAQSEQNLPPECMPGGYIYEAQKANSFLGAAKAMKRVEFEFANVVPVPAAAQNCISRILGMFDRIAAFSWPPNLSSLFSGFFNRLLNMACDTLWQAIRGSSFFASYNEIVSGYNQQVNCANNLATCGPLAAARQNILSMF